MENVEEVKKKSKKKESNKKSCENYLFEDYRWKSGIPIRILALMTSGSNPRRGFWQD